MPRTKKSDTTGATASTASYGALRAELDDALLKLQNPEVDVDEAVDVYEKALALVTALEQHIAKAENRITTIQAGIQSR